MKKLLKVLGIVLGSLLLLLIALVQKIDRTPYTQSMYYKEWEEWINHKTFSPILADSMQVGWSKASIVPDFSAPMSGYGDRWGKHFETVRDSLFVRALTVQYGPKNLTFLSADLLIVPPNVTNRLGELLKKDGISIDELHLGAIHTHHGVGGWGQKLLGRLFAGKYDLRMEELLAEQMRNAILKSRENLKNATAEYIELEFEEGIRNRLPIDSPLVKDPEIRSLSFKRSDGSRAVMLVYGAHTTILSAEMLALSRDYPGYTVDILEADEEIDFALYYAGAVGSMGYVSKGDTPEERSQYLGTELAEQFLNRSDSDQFFIPENQPFHSVQNGLNNSTPLLSEWVPVPLPPATLRIDLNYSLRPWVFNMLFGSSPGDIKVSLVGSTLLLGMPADFSGEIMVELDAFARSKGLDLIITSFNGNYMGYITHDQHYEKNMYETVTMSWNGYEAGSYYTEVAKDIITGISQSLSNLNTQVI